MAQLLDKASAPSSKSEIEYFTVPSTQVAVEKGFWVEVNPLNTVTNAGPFEFHLPSSPHFLDLSKNYVHLQLKITRGDGTNLQDGDQVGPINLIGKTFFKQVKLFLNSKLAYDSGDTYPYRSYLETEFNYDYSSKQSALKACGYQEDTPVGQIDAAGNQGWTDRCDWFAHSAVVEFMAPLHIDLFHQEKYLLNNMDLRLELHRQGEPFALMSFNQNPGFRLQVANIKWHVRKVDLLKNISLALESTLLHSTAKFPIRRVQIKTLELTPGRRDTPTNAIFTGQIPRRLIFGCVDSDAFHGNWEKSPFNFKHFSATSVQVTAAGQNYPASPLLMDFTTNMIVKPFIQLYEALGLAGTDKSCYLDLNDYAHGHALYAFDLSPGHERRQPLGADYRRDGDDSDDLCQSQFPTRV